MQSVFNRCLHGAEELRLDRHSFAHTGCGESADMRDEEMNSMKIRRRSLLMICMLLLLLLDLVQTKVHLEWCEQLLECSFFFLFRLGMKIRATDSASDLLSYTGGEHGKEHGLNRVENKPIRVLPMMVVIKNRTENYATISC